MNIYNDNLKKIRKQKGLTQEQLAEKVNTSRAYITQLETGHRTPTLDLVDRIAKALNTPIKAFFEEN